jgi:hypothetical protein
MYQRSLELVVNDLVFLEVEGCNKGNAWNGQEQKENFFDIAGNKIKRLQMPDRCDAMTLIHEGFWYNGDIHGCDQDNP